MQRLWSIPAFLIALPIHNWNILSHHPILYTSWSIFLFLSIDFEADSIFGLGEAISFKYSSHCSSALDLVVNRRVISRASLGPFLPPPPSVGSWTTQASTLGTPETPGEMPQSTWEHCHTHPHRHILIDLKSSRRRPFLWTSISISTLYIHSFIYWSNLQFLCK